MAPQVFISHSSADAAVAQVFCDALEGGGIRCWIAPRDIPPGSEWSEAVVAALVASPVLLLLLSESANESPHVKREVQRSFERGRQVIPVRLQAVTPSRALEYYISPVQWLDAFPPPVQDHLPKVIDAVTAILRAGPEATKKNPAARDGAAPAAASVSAAAAAPARGFKFSIHSPKVGCALSVALVVIIASALNFYDSGDRNPRLDRPSGGGSAQPLRSQSVMPPSDLSPPKPATTQSTTHYLPTSQSTTHYLPTSYRATTVRPTGGQTDP